MANIVLGGGIGGLSTAYYLAKHTTKGVKLFEASERFGGWIRTSQSENGTRFELGPRTIRCQGDPAKNTLNMVQDLGLANSVVPVLRTQAAAKNRMIYVNNKLHLLPNNLKGLLRTTPPFSKPIALSVIKDIFTPRKRVTDESIYDFIARRLGKELADLAISPMVCGVHAGDAKEISAKSFMKQLFEAEQKYGSLTLGTVRGMLKKSKAPRMRTQSDLYAKCLREKWSVWSLKDGLETLPKTLSQHLRGHKQVELQAKAKCTKLTLTKGKVVATIDNKEVVGERVYSSLPSYELAQLLVEEHRFLREQLSAIPFVTVGVVNLEYNGDVLHNEGFGYLVPPNQNRPVLGVLFDTCCFPQNGRTVLTVMMGGSWFEKHFGSNPKNELLLETAIKEVQTALKIISPPSSSFVSIHRNCIPQYVIGHSDRLQRMRDYLTQQQLPLSLVGASYDGIGVNDVIISGRNAVQGFESIEM